MINLRNSATLGLTLIATLACAATAQEQWAQITANYCKLEVKKDTKGLAKIINEHFAPELKYIPLTGPTMDRRGFMKAEMDQIAMVEKFTKVDIKMSKFVVKGNSATADCAFHLAANLKVPKGEKPVKLTADGTMKFKYALKNGTWWATEMKEVTNKVLINGKPQPTLAPATNRSPN